MTNDTAERFYWIGITIELLLALPLVVIIHVTAAEFHRARTFREIESRLRQEPLTAVILDAKYTDIAHFRGVWQRLSLDSIAPLLDSKSELSEEQYRSFQAKMPQSGYWSSRLFEPIQHEVGHLHEIIKKRKILDNLAKKDSAELELVATLRLQEQQSRERLEDKLKESFMTILIDLNRSRNKGVTAELYSSMRPVLLSIGIDAPPLP